MIELFNEVCGVVVTLWNLGSRRSRRGMRLARRGIRIVFGVILLWPFILLMASLTGSPGFVAAIAMVPLAAILLLIFIYPLVSGVLAAFHVGRTFYLWLGIALFAEMIIGLYFAIIPVWNNPGLIPVLALLVVVLGMFLILKRQFGFRQGGWFSTALALAIVVVTVVFLFSGRSKEKTAEAAVQAGAGVSQTVQAKGREIVRIQLLGESRPSEKFLGPRMVPAGWDYFFEGPPEAKVHFDDGTVGPITKWYGLKGGIRRFSGPEGQEVIVKAYPPPQK